MSLFKEVNRLKKRLLCFMAALCIVISVLPAAAFVTASALESVSESAGELPYVETVFNERNGLPTGEANDVLQTSDGYIWVGSYGGLIRCDGTEFRNFSTEGILPSSSVRMMFEDSAGRLWVGTNDAGVFVYENDKISQPEGQPSDSFLCVRGFAEDESGTVYACSNSGIAEIKDGVMEVCGDTAIAGKTVYSLGVDKFGRVWGADSDGGCVVFKDGKVIRTVGAEEFLGSGQSVYSVTSGPNGEIWLGSSGNIIARLDFNGKNFTDSDISVALYTMEQVNTVNSLRMMDDGTLTVSGLIGFGMLYPDGTMREFGEKLGAVSVNSSYIDYEGNIWLASTSTGIVRYSVGCFTSPNDDAGLEGVALNAIAVCGGKSYIGLDSGLIICGEDWSREVNDLTEMFDGIRVRNIIADSAGRVWIASYSDTPVVCYDTASGEIISYSSDDGLAGGKARVLMELSDGRIAAGTQGGLSIIGRDGSIESYTDLEYPAILSLLETADGSILAGSDGGGIYEIKDGTVTNHGFAEGLNEGVILRMLKDEVGGGYFVSAGSSLYYWENGAFKRFDALEKEAGSIFDFCQSGNTLWLMQNNGMLAIDRENLLAGGNGDPVTYGFQYGLTGSLNANTWHCLNDGKLYLATRNGVSVFSFKTPENELPKGIINSVTVDGVTYEHPNEIIVSGNAQRVTINFAALTFTDTTRFSASYQLEGFDSESAVLDSIKSNSVSYTNLPGGEYTFRLRLCSFDDPAESKECSFTIIKQKRLSEQPFFWICIVILLIAAAAGAVLLVSNAKLRRARRRQEEYRDILEQSLLTFAGTIDAKDKYTNGHSIRVAQYSRELARRMGMSAQEQEHIYYVALLHDIGKIGIPDNVLNKPGKLTPEEREIIQRHPKIGSEILKNFTALEGISEGAKYHHERYDGNGYCEGLAGENIPLVARIIGVADTYDAMSSERCYRKPLSEEVIISELEKAKGTQLDPNIVPHMLDMMRDGTTDILKEQRSIIDNGQLTMDN